MGRTKQTVKPKVIPGKGPGKGKSLPIPKKITVRRFSQSVKCLREIRKAVKALNLAIPRLPFQRLCRQICDDWSIGKRWRRDALECLQEAAEDFLIEFFQDSYICAAHAKRVTLMDKDFVTLRRLRYRFSKLLEPLPFTDEKTFNILNVPPYRKPKPGDVGIKIEEVTHERDTRKARQAELQKEEHSKALRREEEFQTQQREKDLRIVLEDELPPLLSAVNPDGFIVRAFSADDPLERDDYITLDKDSVTRLKTKSRELNDTIVLATLRYYFSIFSRESSTIAFPFSYIVMVFLCRFAMLEFPKDIQAVIEVIDPTISHYIRVEPDIFDLDRWVTNVNMEKVEIIFIPYNEK